MIRVYQVWPCDWKDSGGGCLWGLSWLRYYRLWKYERMFSPFAVKVIHCSWHRLKRLLPGSKEGKYFLINWQRKKKQDDLRWVSEANKYFWHFFRWTQASWSQPMCRLQRRLLSTDQLNRTREPSQANSLFLRTSRSGCWWNEIHLCSWSCAL